MIKKVSALAIGFAFTALGCYGVYDYTTGLEGGRITYLVFAAVAVAGLPSVTPYFAEEAWRERHRVKAVLFFALFFLSAAAVIFQTRDRVHLTTAGAVAERGATRGSLSRAETALTEAKRKRDEAEDNANDKRALPREPQSKKAAADSWCDSACVARWDAEAAAARRRVTEASKAVDGAQGKAIDDGNPPPAWLLPLCIDVGGFLLLSYGFAIPARRRETAVPVIEATPEPAAIAITPVIEIQPEPPVETKVTKRPARKARGKARMPKTRMPMVTAAAIRAAQTLH